MSNACKWNRSLQIYECDPQQSTAILKAALEQALVTFVHIVQAWFWENLVPFYEAHPILTVLLGLIILGSIFRRR
jgi:hypothetical protein